MIAAATFLVEPAKVPSLLVGVSLAGGVLSAAWFVASTVWPRRSCDEALSTPTGESWTARRAPDEPQTVPYGVAILVGCAAVLTGALP